MPVLAGCQAFLPPSRNVVMRRCRIRNGHQSTASGSELSGGVENGFLDDCRFDHADSSVPSAIDNVSYVKTNERRGGFVRFDNRADVRA
jgi:polygalacturonase